MPLTCADCAKENCWSYGDKDTTIDGGCFEPKEQKMAGICSAHQGYDPTCRLCNIIQPIVWTMPWERPELEGWAIVGMNHYRVDGVRYLFCSMTKKGNCITAEGVDESLVFDTLCNLAKLYVLEHANDKINLE